MSVDFFDSPWCAPDTDLPSGVNAGTEAPAPAPGATPAVVPFPHGADEAPDKAKGAADAAAPAPLGRYLHLTATRPDLADLAHVGPQLAGWVANA